MLYPELLPAAPHRVRRAFERVDGRDSALPIEEKDVAIGAEAGAGKFGGIRATILPHEIHQITGAGESANVVVDVAIVGILAEQNPAARAHANVVWLVQHGGTRRFEDEHELAAVRRGAVLPDLAAAGVSAGCRIEENAAVAIPASFEALEDGCPAGERLAKDRGRIGFRVGR